jgi:hypothetical protein
MFWTKYVFLLLALNYSQSLLETPQLIRQILSTPEGTYILKENATLKLVESGKEWLVPSEYRKVLQIDYGVNGELYFASQKGILKFEPKLNKYKAYSPDFLGCKNTRVEVVKVFSPYVYLTCGNHFVRIHLGNSQRIIEAFPVYKIGINDILPLGNHVLFASKKQGLWVFNKNDKSWSKFDKLDGLPSNNIQELQIKGSKILLITPSGLAWWDIKTNQISLETKKSIQYGQVYNDVFYGIDEMGWIEYSFESKKWKEKKPQQEPLMLTTLESSPFGILYALDGQGLYRKTFSQSPVDVFGASGKIIVKYADAKSIRKVSAKIAFEGESWEQLTIDGVKRENGDWAIPLPEMYQGFLIVAISTTNALGNSNSSYRVVYDDIIPPKLKVKDIEKNTAVDRIAIQGKIKDQDVISLKLQPHNREIPISPGGFFKVPLKLLPGSNHFSIVALDVAGNVSNLPFDVVLDNSSPEFDLGVIPDTVPVSFFQSIIPLKEIPSKIEILPKRNIDWKQVGKSIDIVGKDLHQGPNHFSVIMQDKAGNKTRKTFEVFYDAPDSAKVDISLRGKRSESKRNEYYRLIYRVKRGETLSSIALRFYGVANMFPILSIYNKIKNPNSLSPGTKLVIPIYKDFTIGRLIPSKEKVPEE